MNNASDTGDNEHIDGDLLRIDQSNLDMDIFSNVYIDSETKEMIYPEGEVRESSEEPAETTKEKEE